ncbi:ribosomal protein S18-alanine N-acetyltransferase [Thermopetrobacter sp. TC1]|uniref:ribosomal protein S18-alanine N-acetyltransferase n=1 Tax=Thermopetrobacter sp. TC1 TaxID=1495045 RepID=UPI00056F5465|nr:ribosomal protein S18-alanine N-acetyltransferase [Thermopetrobacter sp. TC1]
MPPESAISLRPLKPDDAASLARMHALSFAQERPWSAEEFARLLAMPTCRGLLLEEDGRLAGFILCQVADREGEILTLAVVPESRRRGHASRLLATAMADMVMSGVQRVILEVAVNNKPARALYESHGFRPAGRRPNYYLTQSGERVDALIMVHISGAGCGCDD